MKFGKNYIQYYQDYKVHEGIPQNIDFTVSLNNMDRGWSLSGYGNGAKENYGNGKVYVYRTEVSKEIALLLDLACESSNDYNNYPNKENNMEIKLTLKVRPWSIPGSIYLEQIPGERLDVFNTHKGIPLCEVEAEVLSMLCDKFRKDIFEEAHKVDPKNG